LWLFGWVDLGRAEVLVLLVLERDPSAELTLAGRSTVRLGPVNQFSRFDHQHRVVRRGDGLCELGGMVHIPMGRFGEADEIAGAVAFLASDDASFIIASTFLVDGGISGAYVTPL